ncbi:MAG: hypothetical protein LBT89_03600, partial [Planctomycetaceae bacterium]|nr:hypothetical protein [Planctomycetaceae bacterium]
MITYNVEEKTTMTDDNDTGGEVKWKMFTRTEKIIIAVLFAAICSGIAYFWLAAAKVSEKPPAPDT